MNIKEHYRVIRDPKNLEETAVPKMPLIIVLKDGSVAEAKTLRGATAVICGNEYMDAEDAIDEYNMRLMAARRESMKVLQEDIYAVVYDSRKGVIENNFAAAPEDTDYTTEDETTKPVKIRIENDRLFLLSLLQIGAISILERADSYILRPHSSWSAKDSGYCCDKCAYKKNSGGDLCPVYNEPKTEDEAKECTSICMVESSIEEYPGGEYIDIAATYKLADLIGKVEETWPVK